MTPELLQELLQAVLSEFSGESDYHELDGIRTRTFDDAGILTSDKGLVVSFPDGSGFQLTIVSWKAPK